MFFAAAFGLSLIGLVALVDRSRWRSSVVIGCLALVLAFTAQLIAQVYPVWDFVGNEAWLFICLSNSSVYVLAAILFVQWYPSGKARGMVAAYWFAWTTLAAAGEILYVYTGHMKYFANWTLWHSYAADWGLYWIFIHAYRLLKLEKLDGE
jgi:hypothetical protein